MMKKSTTTTIRHGPFRVQEEYLLFKKDREIRRCGNSDRLPVLKNEHARLRTAFIRKLARYYGLEK